MRSDTSPALHRIPFTPSEIAAAIAPALVAITGMPNCSAIRAF